MKYKKKFGFKRLDSNKDTIGKFIFPVNRYNYSLLRYIIT